MKLNDLYLHVQCAMFEDEPVFVAAGLVAAKKRLLSRGLIEEHPNVKNYVRITSAGLVFVEKLLKIEP